MYLYPRVYNTPVVQYFERIKTYVHWQNGTNEHGPPTVFIPLTVVTEYNDVVIMNNTWPSFGSSFNRWPKLYVTFDEMENKIILRPESLPWHLCKAKLFYIQNCMLSLIWVVLISVDHWRTNCELLMAVHNWSKLLYRQCCYNLASMQKDYVFCGFLNFYWLFRNVRLKSRTWKTVRRITPLRFYRTSVNLSMNNISVKKY